MSNRRDLWPRTPRQVAERIYLRLAPYVQQRAIERPEQTPVSDRTANVCVSLTTYGKRTGQVHLTIESIARGRMKPARMVLWLDEEDWKHPPQPLKRLADRGLELMRARAEWGPHKKYFPYCRSSADDGRLLVTADDDVLYPRRWLADLTAAAERHESAVVAHKARHLTLEGDELAPYSAWAAATSANPSHRNVAIGAGGVAYPPTVQKVLRDAGDAFMHVAPRADDLWLKLHELRGGFPVAQVRDRAVDFPLVLGSQTGALAAENQLGGRNDAVIRALFSPADVARLGPVTAAAAR